MVSYLMGFASINTQTLRLVESGLRLLKLLLSSSHTSARIAIRVQANWASSYCGIKKKNMYRDIQNYYEVFLLNISFY